MAMIPATVFGVVYGINFFTQTGNAIQNNDTTKTSIVELNQLIKDTDNGIAEKEGMITELVKNGTDSEKKNQLTAEIKQVNDRKQALLKERETTYGTLTKSTFQESLSTFTYLLPLIILYMIIGVFFERQTMFAFTGAREITRTDYPRLYNIVENLCISRGLTIPKIGILDDNSLNAFATGWNPKNSWIVFSKGIIDSLDDREIAAVAGHELTHIINGDVRNMVIINVFIGAIGTIGYYMMRAGARGNSRKSGGGLVIILGLGLYLISLTLLPLINLALSRKKEFLADAGSVMITGDKEAMISALQKISKNAVIRKIETKPSTVAGMFIAYPKSTLSSIGGLFATHPPIEERIAVLQTY